MTTVERCDVCGVDPERQTHLLAVHIAAEKPDLIEDLDGAPLPDTLQSGSPIWHAVNSALRQHVVFAEGEIGDDLTDEIMRALTPLLWPLLPDNDGSQLSRLITACHAMLAVSEGLHYVANGVRLRYALASIDCVLRECGATSCEGDVCQLRRGHEREGMPYHRDGLGDAWNKQWGQVPPHPDWDGAHQPTVEFAGPEPF